MEHIHTAAYGRAQTGADGYILKEVAAFGKPTQE